MDDDELQKLRSVFAGAEEKRAPSKVKDFLKKISARLDRKPKEDDFKRFQPKRRKKAS